MQTAGCCLISDCDSLHMMRKERDVALARVEALLAELTEVLDYAGHRAGCLAEVYAAGEPGPCTCGWDAMRKRHREAWVP